MSEKRHANIGGWFPSTYPESRSRFCKRLSELTIRWPNATLNEQALPGQEGLALDWIAADALESPLNLLIITAGLHGIEGYVGSAVTQLFLDEFLPLLTPAHTGLRLVHAINPWGMSHWKRSNPANVDLNRNFVFASADVGDATFTPVQNPLYPRLRQLLEPKQPVRASRLSNFKLYLQILAAVMKIGATGLQEAGLRGQSLSQQGIYYSGTGYQPETKIMMGLYRKWLAAYERVLLVDIHSGYGPRYQMSLVLSNQEEKSSAYFRDSLFYPRIVKNNTEEFYQIQGDMVDYLYRLKHRDFPDKRLFALAFEFGTFGDSTLALMRSLRCTIQINQLAWNGAATVEDERKILKEYQELFYPGESAWRNKALDDARQAFGGILKAHRLIE